MTRYTIFSDTKLNDLLTKLLNNPDEIKVSEKLILIGNLSETLNTRSGSIVNTINKLKISNREVLTSIAPSTLNNLLSDVHLMLSTNLGNNGIMEDKYNFLDITGILNRKDNYDQLFTYIPDIKITNKNFIGINGKNSELITLIENLSLNLIIKIYVVVLGLV